VSARPLLKISGKLPERGREEDHGKRIRDWGEGGDDKFNEWKSAERHIANTLTPDTC